MTVFWSTVGAILAKDLLSEFRNKETVTSILSFSLLSLIILNFALRPTPSLISVVAPGILWVAFTFSGILGLTRAFALEEDQDAIQGLLLTPASREAIYLGKMLSCLVFMLVAEIVLLPIFAVLFNVDPFKPMLMVVMFMATLGFASVGTLFSALAMNTKSREIMLPMLFIPIVVPIIIAAVVGTDLALRGGGWQDISKWIQLMLVFDLIAVVFCAFGFDYVAED